MNVHCIIVKRHNKFLTYFINKEKYNILNIDIDDEKYESNSL